MGWCLRALGHVHRAESRYQRSIFRKALPPFLSPSHLGICKALTTFWASWFLHGCQAGNMFWFDSIAQSAMGKWVLFSKWQRCSIKIFQKTFPGWICSCRRRSRRGCRGAWSKWEETTSWWPLAPFAPEQPPGLPAEQPAKPHWRAGHPTTV